MKNYKKKDEIERVKETEDKKKKQTNIEFSVGLNKTN